MTPQAQAFIYWYENQPTFGVDYQEIWDAACKWQRDEIHLHLYKYDDGEIYMTDESYKEIFNEYD